MTAWVVGGNWRSLPWPFGLLDVKDSELVIRSWHWSWWLRSRRFPRDLIDRVDTQRQLGATLLTIIVKDDLPVEIRSPHVSNTLIEDLVAHGYEVTENGLLPPP